MAIRIKRAYEAVDEADGWRILVDRYWPRGLSKEAARLDSWAREIAPSDELRRWFGHEHGHAPEQWPGFLQRYHAELDSKPDEVRKLVEMMSGQPTTLVYSLNNRWNNALALKTYLEANYPQLR
ncbi:MAG: DUF488 family protein [Desulfuromonadales bacterium]|nr:DUF488 family protein [Desulfuromonadales bacterium]